MFTAINTSASKLKNVETVVCPPLVYLESLGEKVTTRSCVLGAQDAFWEHVGPYTGQVSPDMIFNTKARYVIVGHSEVRKLGETDEMVNKKIQGILQFPLIPVICVGETVRDDDGAHIKFVKHQVKQALLGLTNEQVGRVVVAYEPVWAIGTGLTATSSDAQTMHAAIRSELRRIGGAAADVVRIQYGGSVKPDNVDELMAQPDIDGALVGGAALVAESFLRIVQYR